MIERSKYQPQNPLERLAEALTYVDENGNNDKNKVNTEDEFDFEVESFEPRPCKYHLDWEFS